VQFSYYSRSSFVASKCQPSCDKNKVSARFLTLHWILHREALLQIIQRSCSVSLVLVSCTVIGLPRVLYGRPTPISCAMGHAAVLVVSAALGATQWSTVPGPFPVSTVLDRTQAPFSSLHWVRRYGKVKINLHCSVSTDLSTFFHERMRDLCSMSEKESKVLHALRIDADIIIRKLASPTVWSIWTSLTAIPRRAPYRVTLINSCPSKLMNMSLKPFINDDNTHRPVYPTALCFPTSYFFSINRSRLYHYNQYCSTGWFNHDSHHPAVRIAVMGPASKARWRFYLYFRVNFIWK